MAYSVPSWMIPRVVQRQVRRGLSARSIATVWVLQWEMRGPDLRFKPSYAEIEADRGLAFARALRTTFTEWHAANQKAMSESRAQVQTVWTRGGFEFGVLIGPPGAIAPCLLPFPRSRWTDALAIRTEAGLEEFIAGLHEGLDALSRMR